MDRVLVVTDNALLGKKLDQEFSDQVEVVSWGDYAMSYYPITTGGHRDSQKVVVDPDGASKQVIMAVAQVFWQNMSEAELKEHVRSLSGLTDSQAVELIRSFIGQGRPREEAEV